HLCRVGRGHVAQLGLRLKRDAQETAVQVDEDSLAVRPHRVTRVVGHVRLGNNTEYLAKPVDQEMVAVVLLYYADHGLPDALQPGVLVRSEARLIAFGGVIYDARGLRTELRLTGVDGSALIYRVKYAPLIGFHVAI